MKRIFSLNNAKILQSFHSPFSSDVSPYSITLFPHQILERIDAPNFLRPDRPDHCPVEIYKIMKHHCWNHIPEERSSFETLEKMILKVFQIISSHKLL